MSVHGKPYSPGRIEKLVMHSFPSTTEAIVEVLLLWLPLLLLVNIQTVTTVITTVDGGNLAPP